MKLKYLAHSAFLITSSKNTTILTDPYEAGGFSGAIGYQPIAEPIDIITISHEHADHNYIGPSHRNAILINQPTSFTLDNIEIKGITTYHDKKLGKDRGKNIIFTIKVDDIAICHLGDLGHKLSIEQIEAIGIIDILLTPIGGIYTIDAEEADVIINALCPKICIPMHYKTEKLGYSLGTVTSFIKNKKNAKIIADSEIELTRNQLPTTTEIWVLPPAKL